MADAFSDETFAIIMLASDLLPHGEPTDIYCGSCYSDAGQAKLLIFRCPECSGLLVACDNASCPYTLDCVCHLPG